MNNEKRKLNKKLKGTKWIPRRGRERERKIVEMGKFEWNAQSK